MIDATVAGENANSYITREEAEQAIYRLGDDKVVYQWLELSEEQKEDLIIFSASLIDRFHYGPKFSEKQAMKFPRLTDTDRLGIPYIPTAIREAQERLLVYMLRYGKEELEQLSVKTETREVSQTLAGFSYELLPSEVKERLRKFILFSAGLV